MSPASVCVCVVAAATLVASQVSDTAYPIFTVNQLDATMKTLGPNVAGVRASLAEGDFTTAKERAIRSREQLATTVTYWRDNSADEALDLLRTALERMDALDTALSADPVDAASVETLSARVGDACAGCHAVYREQDAATREYRLKRSALP